MGNGKCQGPPVVLVLEDIRWADPTTLDLLRGIAERGALVPLFVLITARPEFRSTWSIRSHHSTILLSARHALLKEVVEDVAARAGGVPLFV
ncbi:MAG: hypothetical protein JO283_21395 [Bradyrhizobium sp.]|nr:hypothetical protein [Bradyrhizobium sp.]